MKNTLLGLLAMLMLCALSQDTTADVDEARSMLGSYKDMLRVHYVKTGGLTDSWAVAKVGRDDLRSDDWMSGEICLQSDVKAVIYAYPLKTDTTDIVEMAFDASTGKNQIDLLTQPTDKGLIDFMTKFKTWLGEAYAKKPFKAGATLADLKAPEDIKAKGDFEVGGLRAWNLYAEDQLSVQFTAKSKKDAKLAAVMLLPNIAEKTHCLRPARDHDAALSGAGMQDPFALYRKKGRKWTVRLTTVFGGTEMESYMRTEVKAVDEEGCTMSVELLDKDKEPMAGMKPTEYRMPFKQGGYATPSGEAPKMEKETIKVEAGEFECYKMETEAGGSKTTSWTSVKFPGLLVKMESKSDNFSSVSELVEFTE